MATNGQQSSRNPTRRRNRSKNILHKIKYGQITGVGMTHGTQVGRQDSYQLLLILSGCAADHRPNRPQEPRAEVTAELTAI